MNEGNYREYGGGGGCYFHPKEIVIGVCHLCLNERLLILAAKHGVNKSNSSKYDYYTSKTSINNSYYDDNKNDNYSSYYHHYHKPKPYVTLPNKIFAIASFFNTRDKSNRHRSRLHRHRHRDSEPQFFDVADCASTSLEDESFISIKFGDNGVASWDKTSSTVSKGVSLEHCSLSWGGQTTVKDASNTTKTKGGTGGISNGTKSVVEHAKPRPVSMRWRKRISQLLQVIRWKKNSKANVGGNNSKVVEGVKVGRNK